MNKTRKAIVLIALLLAFAPVSQSQIFFSEDETGSRSGTETDMGVIPLNGVTWDQTNETYTPLGDGMLVLATLGTAYLMKNKRKKKNRR